MSNRRTASGVGGEPQRAHSGGGGIGPQRPQEFGFSEMSQVLKQGRPFDSHVQGPVIQTDHARMPRLVRPDGRLPRRLKGGAGSGTLNRESAEDLLDQPSDPTGLAVHGADRHSVPYTSMLNGMTR